MNQPDISIIIRTLNEELYLYDLLSSINRQQTSFSYEVILIDSGSTDKTLNIAAQFLCHILHINRQEFSFGRSLNRACEYAKGSYLVIISGHCIPCDHHWLQQLVKPLAEKKVDYCYGRQVGGACTYFSESQIFAKYFPDKTSIPQIGYYCNNANSAITAEIWKRYRFDENLTGLEDMHLAKRLAADHGSIGYTSEASVYHLHHENWQQIQRRFEREALALQHICPEVLLRRRDVLRYFCRAAIGDISANWPASSKPKSLLHIVKYRYHQYIGSYIGNHDHKQMSSQLRDSYYYPLT